MENFKNSLEKLDTLIEKLEVNTNTCENPKEKKPEPKKTTCPNPSQKTPEDSPTPSPEETKITNDEKPKKKKKQKKPKKVKPPKDPKELKKALFCQADLRVGEIIECLPLEGSDKLYIEKIKFSETETRTILSGLQKFVPLDQMKGKCIVFYNLKPRKLAGNMSNGMVVCSQNKDHTSVDLVRPDDSAQLGDRVELLGQDLVMGEVGNINSKKMKKFLELLSTDKVGSCMFSEWGLGVRGIELRKAKQVDGTIG